MEEPTLLLVEDEPDLREALGEYFSACGFAVTPVATAGAAFAAAARVPFRLVLCDLSLPDRRGDAFLVDFHALYPSSVLYVHSGDSTFVPTPELLAAGVTRQRVFAKPADLSRLVAQFQADLAL